MSVPSRLRLGPPLRRLKALASVAALALSVGCIDAETTARIHERDDRFARQFIQDLHARGLAGVRDRMKPATLQGAQDPEAAFAVMMSALPPGPIDSIRPLGGEIEQDGKMAVSKLYYRVYGSQRVAEVEFWIETSPNAQYVETLRVTDVSSEIQPAASGDT
jgi:hypothetical protein